MMRRAKFSLVSVATYALCAPSDHAPFIHKLRSSYANAFTPKPHGPSYRVRSVVHDWIRNRPGSPQRSESLNRFRWQGDGPPQTDHSDPGRKDCERWRSRAKGCDHLRSLPVDGAARLD